MDVLVTWEGNTDGAQRTVVLSSRTKRLWVSFKTQHDKSSSREISITPTIRDTRFGGALRALVRKLRLAKDADCPTIQRQPSPLKDGSYVVSGLPCDRLQPYWLDICASTKDDEGNNQGLEEAHLYVVPADSRRLSSVFIIVGALALIYINWMLWNVGSTPDGLAKLVPTVATVAPVFGIAGPLLSATVRRLAHDVVFTGVVLALMLGSAVAIRVKQEPLYVENAALSGIELRKQLFLEPGQAAVSPRSALDADLVAYFDCARDTPSEDCEKKLGPRHWFRTGNLCVIEGEEDCTELRSTSWLDRLQRWMSLGESVRIGCRAPDGLDGDYLDEWKRSKSCKRDPDLRVTHPLKDHLLARRVEAESCPNSLAEVDVHPFRIAEKSASDLTLQPLELIWPDDATGSLPSWRFTNSGPIAEVRLPTVAISSKANTTQQCSPYGDRCENEHRCATLYAPPGQLSASIERGGQKLGTLWCAEGAHSVYAIRLKSRLEQLRVLKAEASTNEQVQTGDLISRYEATSFGMGEYVFWCEPDQRKLADGSQAPLLSAEVTLASDWQPDQHWSWPLPKRSKIQRLELNIKDRGRWGNLDCAGDGERTLNLRRGNIATSQALVEATLDVMRSNRPPARVSSWERYTEAGVYPAWVWYCTGEDAQRSSPLSVKVGEKSGKLQGDGTFVPYAGMPCLLDPMTKKAIGRADGPYDKQLQARFSGVADLLSWPDPRCDPNRSYLAPIVKAQAELDRKQREAARGGLEVAAQ